MSLINPQFSVAADVCLVPGVPGTDEIMSVVSSGHTFTKVRTESGAVKTIANWKIMLAW